MKTILITGGTKGLGKTLSNYFEKNYKVVTVSRSKDATLIGDLGDIDFRNYIVKSVMPDIFINNAGIISQSTSDVLNINTVAACHLAYEFYMKMKSGGMIINIASSCATKSGQENMSSWRINYHTSKAALKKMSDNLSACKRRNIRVSCLEPAHIDTSLTGGPFSIESEPLKGEERTTFYPMPTSYIADVINWLLSQPSWVNIDNVKISNMHNTKECDMPLNID